MAGNRSVTHALPPILLCPHLNDISSPLSVNELHSCFSPQHSSDQLFPRGYNKDSASLRDQNMFGMNGSVHQPDHVCALGDRGLDSMQAGTGFTLEPHLSNRSAQLYQDHWSPRMPAADPCSIGSASFSTAASRRYQSGPAVAYPESRSRYTASIASPTISSSRLGSLYGHADTEALTSTWQGQPLETRCTSTGHTSYARPTLSGSACMHVTRCMPHHVGSTAWLSNVQHARSLPFHHKLTPPVHTATWEVLVGHSVWHATL